MRRRQACGPGRRTQSGDGPTARPYADAAPNDGLRDQTAQDAQAALL